MASTYVNDLRLNEMATGDGSGTWGTTTNTNLELIGEALGYGTEGITTNADTHTSTIADGATDPVRAMYVKYTGTLDSACTITIAPNTINRMQFIENGTSGSQNIIISQGSGANVTIPAGDTKAVYLDGAGSGAAVVDAFASLNVVDLKVEDDLTVTDDLIVKGDIDLAGSIDVDGTANLDVVDIDGAVDMASTLQVDGVITTSDGMVITTADNTDTLSLISTDADANSGPNLRLYRNSGSPADNDAVGDIQYEGRNDNSQDVIYASIAGYIDDASDGTEDGVLHINTMVGGTLRNRMSALLSSTVFNESGQDLDFRVESDGLTNAFVIDGGNNGIGFGATPRSDLHTTWQQIFFGEKGSIISERLGSGGLYGTIITDNLYIDSDTGAFAAITTDESSVYDQEAGMHRFRTAASASAGAAPTLVENLRMSSSAVTVNEGSADIDFRVESNLNTHALFVDGAQNSVVGVGVTPEGWETDATAIQVGGIGAFWGKTAQAASAGTFMSNNVYDNAGVGQAYIVTDEAAIYKQDDGIHTFYVTASGSADAAITWTTGFEVLNNGKARSKNGLLFGTDTGAANTLDDYEEGTWDPSLIGTTGSAGTWAESAWQAKYTKIGGVCFFHGTGYLTNKGSYTGDTRLTGLPFTNTGSTTAVALAMFPDNDTDRKAAQTSGATEVRFYEGAKTDVAHAYSDIQTGYYCNVSGHILTW